jgi:hypothetical protein
MRRLLRTAWAALSDPGARAALGVATRVRGFYRTSYLAGLASGPLLERLAQGPASLDELARALDHQDPAASTGTRSRAGSPLVSASEYSARHAGCSL